MCSVESIYVRKCVVLIDSFVSGM